jgi:hypothetical protein
MKLLFADDQIPWDDEERDNRVLAEIKVEKAEYFKNRGKTVESAYDEDREWISDLIQFLKTQLVPKCEIITEQEYDSAKKRIENKEEISVAIIDLSWTGDYRLPRGKRSNVGTELIHLLKSNNSDAIVIAFSQNYSSQPALMDKIVQMGAFPLQKTYTEVDKQALASVIAFFSKYNVASNCTRDSSSELDQEIDLSKVSIGKLIKMTTSSQLWKLICALATVLVLVAGGSYKLGAGNWSWQLEPNDQMQPTQKTRG